jgi:hypothetical protein
MKPSIVHCHYMYSAGLNTTPDAPLTCSPPSPRTPSFRFIVLFEVFATGWGISRRSRSCCGCNRSVCCSIELLRELVPSLNDFYRVRQCRMLILMVILVCKTMRSEAEFPKLTRTHANVKEAQPQHRLRALTLEGHGSLGAHRRQEARPPRAQSSSVSSYYHLLYPSVLERFLRTTCCEGRSSAFAHQLCEEERHKSSGPEFSIE